MARRRRAREVALQMLFQRDVNPDIPTEIVRGMVEEQLHCGPLCEFAWSLFAGVTDHWSELDQQIEATSENWRLDRMAPTDRNVLRLGAFELLHTDTPPRVAVDEAIELARRFGGAQSPQFVNGILDRLMLEGDRAPS